VPEDLGNGDREVLLERDGPVATLTINRPERRNALSSKVLDGLRTGVAQAKADPDVRVLVLTGAGDKAFCAGADLVGPSPVTGGATGAGEGQSDSVALHEARGNLRALFEDLWGVGKPTIARVRGYALAGGMGLALACDLVVAAEDAVFGMPEIDIGIWPYMITVPLLRSMPPKRALELMMTGRRVTAREAEAMGFVTEVATVEQLDEAVIDLAHKLARKAPTSMRIGRDSFYKVLSMSSSEALTYMQAMLSVATGSDEAAEGRAAFAERRPPRWAAED
jgi:enoyl-CoA hydratase/carnithine racemase